MLAFAPCTSLSDHADWSVSLAELRRPRQAVTSSFVPMSQRAAVRADFSEVLADCADTGWSGERSDPISPEAANAAAKLIDHMPSDIPDPSVGAIPEGLVTFEWYRSPKRVVLVVPTANNSVDYSIRRGNELLHGSAPFFGKLPETVLSQIRALAR